MKPPTRIYATAYKNQNGEVIVQAGQSIADVMESDEKLLVGIYLLQEVVTAEKIVKTTPVR